LNVSKIAMLQLQKSFHIYCPISYSTAFFFSPVKRIRLNASKAFNEGCFDVLLSARGLILATTESLTPK
jgi:hypothetical protein